MFRRTIMASLTGATLLLTAACGNDISTADPGDPSSPTVAPTSSVAATHEPSPSEVVSSPSDVDPSSEAEPSPSEAEPTPSEAEPTPSEAEPTPSEAEPTPSEVEPSSSTPERPSSAPASSEAPTPSSAAPSDDAAVLPVLACGDGTVLAQFIQLTPEQAVARKAELAKSYPGATIAQVDTACTTPDHDPIVIAWWSVDGTTGNDTEELFRLRRAQGNGRAVVLAMFPHGAYYYSSGLCSLTAAGSTPRIGPNTPITSTNKPLLFEMTSILAANGFIHPDNSGVTTMSSEVVAGVRAFQYAKSLGIDGWIGPDTVAAAEKDVCRNGEPVTTDL